jgi:hypothetical protein
MTNLTQPPDSNPPAPLAARIAKVREAMEPVEAWFDGGLPTEPW